MSIVVKPFTFTAGATIIASEHNSNFDTLYNDYNGNITNANISASAAIVDTKLASITTPGKISGASLSGLASIPSTAGGLPYANMPPGLPMPYPATSAPTGCLALDGTAISRTTYSILFTLYSTTFGVGNGTTTFNLPDMRGVGIMGYASAQTEFDAIGETGGAKTVTLTAAQVPALGISLAGRNANGWNLTDNFVQGSSDAGGSGTITSTTSTGSGGSHTNLQPYITWLWICSTGGQ